MMRLYAVRVVVWCVLLLWGGVTAFRLNTVWRSDLALWREASALNPCEGRPWLELAAAGARIGNDQIVREAWPRVEAMAQGRPCVR